MKMKMECFSMQPERHKVGNQIGAKDTIRTILLGMIMLCLSSSALAMPPRRITAEEKALLPPYCKYTQGGHVGHENPQFPTAGAKRWVGVFGGGGNGMTAHLWRMHHYCYALVHMMRGQRAGLSNMQYREAWLGVIEEIDFTVQFLPPDFVLMPEMMLNRGRALLRLKKGEAAMTNFQQAIDLKPDYWPPYLEIAEYRVMTGSKAQAIEVLQEGLRSAPSANVLKQRLAELGGDMPTPRGNEESHASPSPSSGLP